MKALKSALAKEIFSVPGNGHRITMGAMRASYEKVASVVINRRQPNGAIEEQRIGVQLAHKAGWVARTP